MAWLATTIWEVRNTANDVNGGAYDSSFGGTDYSEQNAAQLSLGDFATPGAGSTTLTTATGGFTPAMVGNGFHPQASGNWVENFYCIVAWVSANQVTLDRSPTPAGAGAAGNGTVGGALATLNKLATHADYVPGNTIWIKSGTTLLAPVMFTVNGTTTNMITVEGYNAARGDAPTLASRPLITAAGNPLVTRQYFCLQHFRLAGTSVDVTNGQLRLVDYSIGNNLKVVNTTGTADRKAIVMAQSQLYGCEVVCTNGKCIAESGGINVHGCYFHDSKEGFRMGWYSNVAFTIFDTMSHYGLYVAGSRAHMIINNTFYNCDCGIYASGMYGWMVLNNIFSDCATFGVFQNTRQDRNLFDHNAYFNNGTDVNNTTKGPNSISGTDPQFTDAPNGDFSIGTNLKGKGYPGAFDGGLSIGSVDMGAVQRIEAAAGGSYAGGFTV